MREATIRIFAEQSIAAVAQARTDHAVCMCGGANAKLTRLSAFGGQSLFGPGCGCARRDQPDIFKRRVRRTLPVNALPYAAQG